MIDPKALEAIKSNPENVVRFVARNRFVTFARYMKPQMEMTNFHKVYYEVLDRFAHGKIKKLIVSVPPQHGKLLSDDTLVPTPGGLVRHGDLKVGDYVFGLGGKPVQVTGVSPKGYARYRVTFTNGQMVDCHGKHEWAVYDTENDTTSVAETLTLRKKPQRKGRRERRKDGTRGQEDGGRKGETGESKQVRDTPPPHAREAGSPYAPFIFVPNFSSYIRPKSFILYSPQIFAPRFRGVFSY